MQRITGSGRTPETLVEGLYTSVPVMYTKRANAATCMACAIASVLFYAGEESHDQKLTSAAGIIYRDGIKLPADSELSSNIHRLVLNALMTCKSGLGVRKDRPGGYFDPLKDECPLPVFAQLKVRADTMAHCVAFCNGLIFDPEYPFALPISLSNLDAICGGEQHYRGLYWSKRFCWTNQLLL
jgi:hypothetical protein